MADDPRKRHHAFTPTDPPTPAKRVMGVRIPPLKVPREPEPKEEPAMPPKVEPIQVERGTSPPATPHDLWAQRITAATALVVALSAAGWGGAKMTERDVPSSQEAKELTQALRSCQRDVASLRKHMEAAEARDREQAATAKLQAKQIIAHAQVIYLLNGRVAPIWRWPEARPDDWISGTDNLHRHVQRGGAYPGAE